MASTGVAGAASEEASNSGIAPCAEGGREFSRRGPNANVVVLTWKVCGRSVRRAFCRDCCTFINKEARHDPRVKKGVLRTVERSAPRNTVQALHNLLEVLPELVCDAVDELVCVRRRRVGVRRRRHAAGRAIVVDRLQGVMHDAVGAVA